MKKRILVVEDDATMLSILRDNLLGEGFEVRCAWTGDQAEKVSTEFRPDLVLLDLMLTGVDGFDLCKALRRHGRMPILIVTARSQKRERLRGFELGADDYVTKPFDLDELLARVRALLRRARPTNAQLILG